MLKNGNRVMRKVKSAWVAALLFSQLGVIPAPEFVAFATGNKQAILTASYSTKFTEKEKQINNEKIIEASRASFANVSTQWKANSVEQIKAEIEKQQAAGLPNYVIQWGDTLSGISVATGLPVETILEDNGLSNRDLIYIGDVLNLFSRLSVVSAPVEQSNVSNVQANRLNNPIFSVAAETTNLEQLVQTVNTSVEVAPLQNVTNQIPAIPVFEEVPAIEEFSENEELPVTGEVSKNEVVSVVDEVIETIPAPDSSSIEIKSNQPTETIINSEEQVQPPVQTAEVVEGGENEVGTSTEVQTEIVPNEPAVIESAVEGEAPETQSPQEDVIETIITSTMKEILPDIVYEYDNTLEKGVQLEIQTGKPATYEIRTTSVNVNGVLTTETVETLGFEEAQASVINTIIKVGTKEKIVTKQVIEVVTEQNFETITQLKDNLYEDEENVVNEGKNGTVISRYEVILEDGVEISRTLIDEVATASENRVVEKGTKPLVSTVEEAKIQSVDFKVEVRNVVLAPNEKAYRKVLTEGTKGEETVVERVTFTRGVETDRVEISRRTTVEAINQVEEVGTPAVILEKTETKELEVPYHTIERENVELEKNTETVVAPGVVGMNRINTSIQYYVDSAGKEVELTRVDSAPEVIIPAEDKIIEFGPKTRYPADFGIEIGTSTDTAGRVITGLRMGEESDIEDIAKLDNDLVYERAKDSKYRNLQEATTDKIYLSAILPNEDFVEEWNSTNVVFDHQIFSEEMLKYVNDLRQSIGVPLLTLDPTLTKYAETRSLEQAEYGSLRTDGKSHVRPDGTSWHTVGAEAKAENIAEDYVDGNPYQYASEKLLAEKFFNLFFNSTTHRASMERSDYRTLGTSAKMNEGHTVANKPIAWAKVIVTQLFGIN